MHSPSPALRRLQTEGALPISAASQTLLRWLAPLLATGVVVRTRAGVGERLQVAQAPVLAHYIDQCFPGGVDAAPPGTRAAAVLRLRNSRLVAPDAPTLVLLRGLPGAQLQGARGAIDLALATADHGAFALAVRDLKRYRLQGSVAVIENREVFFHAEQLLAWGLPARTFVLGNGRLPLRLRDWLRAQDAELWHCGDYDAAGLCDYLSLRGGQARVHLLLPPELPALLARYGKRTLSISSAELERLQLQSADPEVERVVAMLAQAGAGLEQEVLLATQPHSSTPAAQTKG